MRRNDQLLVTVPGPFVWSVTAVLARHGGRWHIVEVGNVYP